MIDPVIIAKAESFHHRYLPLTEYSALYALDGTWNSLETVNSIFSSIVLGADLDDEGREIVGEISAYLAVIAADLWEETGAYVSLKMSDVHGLVLQASGGEVLDHSSKHEVWIEKDLTSLLLNKVTQIEVVPGFSRPVVPGDNFIKLYCHGLFSGTCSTGRGAWQGEGIVKLQAYQSQIEKKIAGGWTRYYQSCFSDEKLGQVAELYLNKLIWPPAFATEFSLASGGALGLTRFFEEHEIAATSQLPLLLNLIRTGDEVLSNAAKAKLASGLAVLPSPEQLYLFAAHGHFNRILRPTVCLLRKEAGFEAEWLQESHTELHSLWFEIERKLGLMYWVKLSSNRLEQRDAVISEVLVKLSFGELDDLKYQLEKMIDREPKDIELRVQQAYLFAEAGEYEKLEVKLRSLLTEPGAEQEARLYHLLAQSQFALGNGEAALDYLETSQSLPARDVYAQNELDDAYVTGLMLMGKVEQGLEQIEKNRSLGINSFSFNNDLNELRLLLKLASYDEIEDLLVRLLEANPFHPEVFQTVMSMRSW